jgi:hypothetical protein
MSKEGEGRGGEGKMEEGKEESVNLCSPGNFHCSSNFRSLKKFRLINFQYRHLLY